MIFLYLLACLFGTGVGCFYAGSLIFGEAAVTLSNVLWTILYLFIGCIGYCKLTEATTPKVPDNKE